LLLFENSMKDISIRYMCSQVWMKALRNLEASQKDEDFLFQPWIYCIAHNAVIDWYRTKKEEVSDEVLECIPYHKDIEKELQDNDALQRVLEFMQ
jgi:DNA-directed RNA polymerase specialized sigma24 family protein